MFIEKLDEIYCRCFPLRVKYVSCKRINKPWLSGALLKSIRGKSRNYKSFKQGIITEAVYKEYRNNVTNTIKEAKRMYYINSFDRCKGDVNNTWKLLNDLMHRGRKRDRSVFSVLIGDDEVSDTNLIANYFNVCFINVANNINSSLPPPLCDPVDGIDVNLPNSFYVTPVTPNEVVD